jgi:hypothetical protein
MLNSLMTDVLPLYTPRWHVEAEHRVAIIDRWGTFKEETGRVHLLETLLKWANAFRITEAWMFDAALETLLMYCPGVRPSADRAVETDGPERFWQSVPGGFHPRFTPKLDNAVWYPPHWGVPEEWDSFKSRVESQFSSQLTQYRRMVELKFGIGREEHLYRDAVWTAKYQRGQTAIEIAESEDLRGFSDPEQVVFRAVDRFAKSIALNLRRRGHRRKKAVVLPNR